MSALVRKFSSWPFLCNSIDEKLPGHVGAYFKAFMDHTEAKDPINLAGVLQDLRPLKCLVVATAIARRFGGEA